MLTSCYIEFDGHLEISVSHLANGKICDVPFAMANEKIFTRKV